MKTKILFIIAFFVLSAFVFSSVEIKGIEYQKGDDFVRILFKTNGIISVPDIFYPDERNENVLIMRVNDVVNSVNKKVFDFDSNIVKSVELNNQQNGIDIKIELKKDVNYRVFTNTRGLFIEFPVIKEVAAEIIPLKKKVQTTAKKQDKRTLLNKKIKSNGNNSTINGNNSVCKLLNYKVISKSDDMAKFEFVFNKNVKYNVIPIEKKPERLAIDFYNTKYKRFNKSYNIFNVKKLRGDYNKSNVFRVVFDLNNWKDFNVSSKDNKIEVTFFSNNNNKSVIAKRLIKKENKVNKKEDVKIESPKVNEVKVAKLIKKENQLENKPKKKESIKSESVEPSKTNNDNMFFKAEKSKSSKENFGYVKFEDDKGNTQITYLRKTIESGKKKYSGEKMDFHFKDADLTDVLKIFHEYSDLNIVTDPDVRGKVTCEFKDVPWDQALELFLKINGLGMVLEGNILRIGKINTLAKEAENRRKLKEAMEMDGNLEVFTRTLSYARVEKVVKILKDQLSKRGKILTDQRTNTLIISEVPEKIKIIDKLIDTLDAANPQVSIEAKIVETETNYVNNFGIQWGYNFIADAAYGNQTSLQFPNSIGIGGNMVTSTTQAGLVGPLGGYAVNLPAPVFNSGTLFTFGNVANTFRLDLALTAMERKGKGRIISAPKTTTQNNMEASIMQGQQIPVQTIQNNTVTTRYVPAALELKVTPQITAKGTIITTLDIKNNSADFANLVMGIPPIITQSIKTTVMVKDGGTIVIGGMYRVEDNKTVEGVPLLSKIPIIGALFKNSQRQGKQKELLVFITPRIIK